MSRFVLSLVAAAALLLPTPARAWWEYGHYTVADVAMLQVRPATRAAIGRLLARERLLDTPECRAGTLRDAAYWPDCIRRYRERFSYSFPWHYQNVDVCRPFDLEAACKDGNCVSAQIERQAKLLANRELPARERLAALAFLAHFVGDIHMPLHAGDRGDRGGNDVRARYGRIEGRANLHSVWDGWIAERGITAPPGGARALLEAVPAGERGAMAAGTVEDWSREGWAVSRDVAYASVLGGDPCAAKPEGRVVIDEERVRAYEPVVRRQTTRGGLRLARLLDEALSTPAKAGIQGTS